MGRLRCDNTYTSLAANRTRESRPSGMRGGLTETWAMVELGTHLAIERARAGHSPPKAVRAVFLPDGDGVQPPLRCGCPPRLTPSVVAPRQAWRLLQGESPCRVRARHPPVSSLASMAEPWRHGEQDGRSVDSVSCRP